MTDIASKFLVVYSGDRDRILFPNTNSFVFDSNDIDFSEFKNSYKIKIKEVILPVSALNYPYITLDIKEIDQKVSGSSQLLNKSFGVLTQKTLGSTQPFISYQAYNSDVKLTKDLSRLSIQFLAPDGSLMNFGSDTSPGTAVTGSVQTTIIFEVIVAISVNAGTNSLMHK